MQRGFLKRVSKRRCKVASFSTDLPSVRLSDHVYDQEARVFQSFCQGMQRQTMHPAQLSLLEGYRKEVQQAAHKAIGPARVLVDGSIAKETHWRVSDVDIVVDTDRPVTRAQVRLLLTGSH